MNLEDLIRHELRLNGHDPDAWALERHATTIATIVAMVRGRCPAVPTILRDLDEATGITDAPLAPAA